MLSRLALTLLATAALFLAAASGASSSAQTTKAQAIAAGWDCSPNITIAGYFHCAPPGAPSLLDVIIGAAAPPTLALRVFDGQTELLAGTELLILEHRLGVRFGVLDFVGADYYGCHHFAA